MEGSAGSASVSGGSGGAAVRRKGGCKCGREHGGGGRASKASRGKGGARGEEEWVDAEEGIVAGTNLRSTARGAEAEDGAAATRSLSAGAAGGWRAVAKSAERRVHNALQGMTGWAGRCGR